MSASQRRVRAAAPPGRRHARGPGRAAAGFALVLSAATVIAGAAAQEPTADQIQPGTALTTPAQPVPVEIVPPASLNPRFGPPTTPFAPMRSVGSAAGTRVGGRSGGGSAPASDPPASRPGLEAGSLENLPNADFKLPVGLRAEDLDVRAVLSLLGRDASVNILIAPGVQGSIRLSMQDVTFRQALDAVLKLAGLAARVENDLVYVYSLDELDNIRTRERTTEVRVYHLNYIRAADLRQMITDGQFLSSEGSISTTPTADVGLGGYGVGFGGTFSDISGGGGGATQGGSAGGATTSGSLTGGDSLAYHDVMIVRDYATNLATIDEIVRRLDVQPPQVLIEAVILSARLRDDQELGVNFSILDNLERLALVSGNAEAINAAAGFTPARVLAADVTRPGPGQLAPGYLPGTQGLKFGFVTDNVTGFIRAVESFNKVNILASPRVLVLNKQRAEIQLGQRLGYRNTVTNLTSSLQTVEFLSVGTLLTLRPFISDDGMVRLEIHPEQSSGALDSQGIPQTNTSELTTNILVPDGATIVIGGLIDDVDSNTESGTPPLNRLPVMGALFRNRATFAQKNELIVLLTPRVLRRGGLPEPVPGVAPKGPLCLPNSGPMPGAPLAPADELGGPLLGPPSDFQPAAPASGDPARLPAPLPAGPLELPPLPGEPATPPISPPTPDPAAIRELPASDPSAVPAGLAEPDRSGSPGWRHSVRPGEDFASISRRYYGSAEYAYALWTANRGRVPRPGDLRAGQEIMVPPATTLPGGTAAQAPEKREEPRPRRFPERRPGGLLRRLRRGPAVTPPPDSGVVPAAHFEGPEPARGYRPGDLIRGLLRRLGSRPDDPPLVAWDAMRMPAAGGGAASPSALDRIVRVGPPAVRTSRPYPHTAPAAETIRVAAARHP